MSQPTKSLPHTTMSIERPFPTLQPEATAQPGASRKLGGPRLERARSAGVERIEMWGS